jgi:DNA-binding NtrC family response regulator
MTATDRNHITRALQSLEWFLKASHPTGVLVASADLDVRLAFAHHLENLGYDVWTAGSGLDAYEVCIGHPVGIDVVVCDAALADLPATELFTLLKTRRSGLRCCVLATDTHCEQATHAARDGAVVLGVDN